MSGEADEIPLQNLAMGLSSLRRRYMEVIIVPRSRIMTLCRMVRRSLTIDDGAYKTRHYFSLTHIPNNLNKYQCQAHILNWFYYNKIHWETLLRIKNASKANPIPSQMHSNDIRLHLKQIITVITVLKEIECVEKSYKTLLPLTFDITICPQFFLFVHFCYSVGFEMRHFVKVIRYNKLTSD